MSLAPLDPALAPVLAATRDAVAAHPQLRGFLGGALDAALPHRDAPPRALPFQPLLGALETADPIAKAIIKAAPRMHWQQSYTAADGFDAEYLDRYGWFNLVSPEGGYLSDAIRISVGYWGSGLFYREHSHAPEEIYLVLAGGARFLADGRAPRQVQAGDTIHHAPHQRHAIDMTPGPLLAMAFWRGNALMKKSDLP